MFSQLMENSVASGEKQMILALLSCQTMSDFLAGAATCKRAFVFYSLHVFGLVLSSQGKTQLGVRLGSIVINCSWYPV